MAAGPLDYYYAILEGEERARYLKTRDIPTDGHHEDHLSGLWRAHDSVSARKKLPSTAMSLLDVKIELAERMLESCSLCERRCLKNRKAGDRGHCGVLEPRVSSEFIHTGEEPDLVPSYTIFFSGCTFNCVYCQNWDISTRPQEGTEFEPETLARMIERRADPGGRGMVTGRIRNVNWVGGDPTSNLPFILKVLKNCDANVPQVWNSNMYLTEEAMNLLAGTMDVYLTDFKYGNDRCALRLSGVKDYVRIVGRNHKLAREQAEMIVRHLVLPGHIECCTRPVLECIANNLKSVKVNVMSQYRPEHRAREFPEISRPLRMSEYKTAIELAEDLGLDLCN